MGTSSGYIIMINPSWSQEQAPEALPLPSSSDGETDEDFKETYKFIQELDISYLHVFTYSERANTPAAEMDNVVPVHIRRERNEMLRILSEKKR